MRDFESICAHLSDQSIDGTTVKACPIFAALIVHLFDDCIFSKAVCVVPLKNLRKLSSVKLGKQKTRTILPVSASETLLNGSPHLANALEDRDNLLEIADVENWKNQLDMTKMTVALLQAFHTGITPVIFIGYSHSFVERSMAIDGSIALEIEQASIGNLDERLVDDISV